MFYPVICFQSKTISILDVSVMSELCCTPDFKVLFLSQGSSYSVCGFTSGICQYKYIREELHLYISPLIAAARDLTCLPSLSNQFSAFFF